MTAPLKIPIPERPELEPMWSSHPVATWLTQHEHAANEIEFFYAALNERLVAAGIPLFRATFGLLSMHPQVYARNFLWHHTDGVQVIDRKIDDGNKREDYVRSPVYLLHQGVDSIRRRLDQPAPMLDFPVLHDLKAEGATDYVAMALHFSTGQINFVSWSTDQAGGFTTEQLSLLHDLLPLISLRLELASAYFMASTLLNTYLGPAAARRVLSGTTRRAEGELIKAAIFYSDLRSFTAMADAVPSEEIIETLNDYFDCMIAPVKSRGGEVLKFVGDGMLAIFQMDRTSADDATCQAVGAAVESFHNLNRLNDRRQADGRTALRAGIALHAGEVMFGNIGSGDRLDFTVIGPAVNEVSRMESLTHMLDKPLLLSAPFAKHNCGSALNSLGFHVLRGVREPRELFTLPDHLLAAGC
jgi:adenylate cyclase